MKILEITDIRVKKILTDSTAESKMRAVVSVTFDDSFVVHDIKIIEGQDKLFTAMPSRKTQEGEYKDIAHPINRDMRLRLEEAILAEYQKVLAQSADEWDRIWLTIILDRMVQNRIKDFQKTKNRIQRRFFVF